MQHAANAATSLAARSARIPLHRTRHRAYRGSAAGSRATPSLVVVTASPVRFYHGPRPRVAHPGPRVAHCGAGARAVVRGRRPGRFVFCLRLECRRGRVRTRWYARATWVVVCYQPCTLVTAAGNVLRRSWPRGETWGTAGIELFAHAARLPAHALLAPVRRWPTLLLELRSWCCWSNRRGFSAVTFRSTVDRRRRVRCALGPYAALRHHHGLCFRRRRCIVTQCGCVLLWRRQWMSLL
jgi:hypothetical protein